MSVDGKTVNEGDVISIDGATGEVFQGAIEAIAPKFSEEQRACADPAVGGRDHAAGGLGKCRLPARRRAGT